jgi:hypothetical protein
MKLTTKHWLLGLIGGSISSAASTITVMIVDPLKFNLTLDGLKNLGVLILVSGIFGAALYLKQSPIPPEENE